MMQVTKQTILQRGVAGGGERIRNQKRSGRAAKKLVTETNKSLAIKKK